MTEKKPHKPSGRRHGSTSELTPKEALWLKYYISGDTANSAAKKAGYAPSMVKNASRVIKNKASVRKALDKHMAKMNKQAEFGLKQALKELDEAIDFAKGTKNATAYVRAVELKSKLMGLMVDKIEHRGEGFHLVIAGIEPPKPVVFEDIPSKQIPPPIDLFEE